MTDYSQAAKRHNKQREDRLSSLHDDILIKILSSIPIDLAIVTGCLSRRWRGLWKNLTSIDISLHNFRGCHDQFFRVFDKIRKGIISPFVHAFSVEFLSHDTWIWYPFLSRWLHQVCDRNVRELKISTHTFLEGDVFGLPSPVFQTRSLVSLELDITFDWKLPDDGADLPNLKSLSISLPAYESRCFENLIKACPSLEELSIKSFRRRLFRDRCFKCSNNNVTRLILDFDYAESSKVVINTPKLEYLNVRAVLYNTFSFESEPIGLREAKIRIFLNPPPLQRVVFRYVTRLTLDMVACYDINFVLTRAKSCPILNVLTLRFRDIGQNGNYSSPPVDESTPLQGIKRIEIEAYWETYDRPMKYFLKLVKYLLRNARDLEHVCFKVVGEDSIKGGVKRKQKRELNMCKRLYKYPIVSTIGCEVEFVGRLLNISRKAGPKVWTTNGEVIPFDTNTHKNSSH